MTRFYPSGTEFFLLVFSHRTEFLLRLLQTKHFMSRLILTDGEKPLRHQSALTRWKTAQIPHSPIGIPLFLSRSNFYTKKTAWKAEEKNDIFSFLEFFHLYFYFTFSVDQTFLLHYFFKILFLKKTFYFTKKFFFLKTRFIVNWFWMNFCEEILFHKKIKNWNKMKNFTPNEIFF